MLTRELAIAKFDGRNLVPDRLNRKCHSAYVEYANRMLDTYRSGVGRTRRSLHQSILRIFSEQSDCPERRKLAFCKLLDDSSDFLKCDRRSISQLRQSVFLAAAKYHPLVVEQNALFENQESEIKRIIAAEHGMDWPQLHNRLFADLIENQVLETFHGYPDGLALLSRYNVAQTQCVFFDAVQMTVVARQDYKQILRYAKLARLMIRITKRSDHYCFELDGPASVLRSTHRYGIAMARFLPGLLACRGWDLKAILRSTPYRPQISFELDDACGLTSPVVVANEFDSSVEKCFAMEWNQLGQSEWRLERETEILHQGQKVFFPDFVFVHRDGLRIMMEIVGFWTPEYLRYKCEVLKHFRDQPIFLAIAHSISVSKKEPSAPLFEHPAIYYKEHIKMDAVIGILDRMRAQMQSG